MVRGGTPSGPGFPVSHEVSTAGLPRTRWLTSEPSRPDERCNAMFILIPFFSSVTNPSFPGTWGLGKWPRSQNLKRLLFS